MKTILEFIANKKPIHREADVVHTYIHSAGIVDDHRWVYITDLNKLERMLQLNHLKLTDGVWSRMRDEYDDGNNFIVSIKRIPGNQVKVIWNIFNPKHYKYVDDISIEDFNPEYWEEHDLFAQ